MNDFVGFQREQFVSGNVKEFGHLEGQQGGGNKAAGFNGADGLPGNAQLVGQLLLRKIVAGALYFYAVFHGDALRIIETF